MGWAAYFHFLLVDRKCVYVSLSELTRFKTGSPLSLPLDFYSPPALLMAPHLLYLNLPFILFLPHYGCSLHNWLLNHPPCPQCLWLLLLLSLLSRSKEHPKQLDHHRMRFNCSTSLINMQGSKGSLRHKLSTSFSYGCPR